MHDPERPTLWTSVRREGDKAALYAELAVELDALLAGEQDRVANAAAAIYHALGALNWAGF
jgi:L-methionine (R)-S-oxide reductase